jgi:hypothetical protein
MKLISKLFAKPVPVAEPTLDERIAKLEDASPDFILGTALGGGDASLRLAAVRRLPDGEALRRIAGLVPRDAATPSMSAEFVAAAQSRCAELIDADAIDFDACLASAAERAPLFKIAALCRDQTRLPALLATVTAPAELAQLVLDGPSSRARQLAAERVTDMAAIKDLLRQVRGRDKNVYKILKQKSDARLAAERKAAEAAAETAGVCASLERHAGRPYDPQYLSTVDYLEQRWRALAPPPDPAVFARGEAAIDRCREIVAQHLRELARLAVQRADEEGAARAAREARGLAERTAQEAAAAAAVAETRRLEQEAAERAAESAARAARAAERERQQRQLSGLIRKAQTALAAGNTREAAGLRRAIDAHPLVKPAPAVGVDVAAPAVAAAGPMLAPQLAQPLRQLDLQLTELKQWKDFAVAPKRLALIETMENLIGSTEEPRALGERIRGLQHEWRTLSQGISSETPDEWERFHRASQAAYQPCLLYAEAQARLRRENLDKRTALLERVRAVEIAQGDAALDARTVTAVLREAPREWRSTFPVEREANAPVQAEFDAVLGRLHARLDSWYAQHIADKEALIERARQLQGEANGPEAVEAAKRLQALWKQTGPAPRDRDQVLWREFRALCDAVFQRREQAYAEHAVKLEAAQRAALGFCEAAEALGGRKPQERAETARKIAELRDAFAAVGELPRGESRDIQVRFSRALAAAESRILEARQRETEQALSDLFEAGKLVHAYEWAVASRSDATRCAELKEAAAAFIEAVPRWPGGGSAALTERLAEADGGGSSGVAAAECCIDAAARERALRLLCVRCEIEAGLATPDEDQSLRREYQVQRLMQGMGQGSAQHPEWIAVVLEWIRARAADPDVLEGLRARFWRCGAHWPTERVPVRRKA